MMLLNDVFMELVVNRNIDPTFPRHKIVSLYPVLLLQGKHFGDNGIMICMALVSMIEEFIIMV
jgi:hypothetical protein